MLNPLLIYIKAENRSVTISGIVPRESNINHNALEVNQELVNLQYAKKQNLIIHIMKTHLNKNRLRFNRCSPLIISKNF